MRTIKTCLTLGLLQLNCWATITINIDADLLKTATGDPMPTTGLVLLVANTNNAGFGSPTADAFVSVGDTVVARWDLSLWNVPGVLINGAVLTLSDAWVAGNPLQLYWYPTLTLSSTSPGPGTPYGVYRDTLGLDGTDPWVTPANGTAAINLRFLTADANAGFHQPGHNLAAAGLSANSTPRAGTTLTVGSSPNPALPGANVTFTATISSGNGTPTGTVQFKADGSPLGAPAALSSGVASLSTSSLSHGNHTITAEYPGSTSFIGSTNNLSQDQVINTPPVAYLATYTRATNLSLKISVPDFLQNSTIDAENDARTLQSVGTGTNGATITFTANWIYYLPSASSPNRNTTDYFDYTISDGFTGGTATSQILVNLINNQPGGPSGSISVINGVATVTMYGIPGVQYDVQRSTDLSNWTTLTTTPLNPDPPFTASESDGHLTFMDDFSDIGTPPDSAYYRLVAH